MIDEKTVQAWLEETSERIRLNEAEASRLQTELARDKRKRQALEALITAEAPGAETIRELDPSARELVSEHPVERAVLTLLEQAAKPLHISELRHALLEKGIPIPGKGTDANVIVYLSRSNLVCRVGKGLYALRAWGVPEVPPRRRRSTRRISKRRNRVA
jgi:hypothetical protein